MIDNGISIENLHFDHVHWKNELNFLRDEVLSFEKRLREVSAAHNEPETRQKVEQFQNRFIGVTQLSENMLNKMEHHEMNLATLAKDKHFNDTDRDVTSHKKMENEICGLRDNFNEMKSEYRQWMETVI